jgi:hypothetical protein
MNKVLIGIGGTGAKILESFAYLTAVGFPGTQLDGLNGSPYHLRMVDTDIENGNIVRTTSLLANLDNEHDGVLSLFADFAKETENTEISKQWKVSQIIHEYYSDTDNLKSDFLWKIDLVNKQTLRSMISEENHVEVEGETKSRQDLLLRALFSENDLKVDQTEGFHARPRIGAMRFEYEFDKDVAKENGFWSTLSTSIFSQGQTQLMFAGSIFGGTGASGIPTLLKRCQTFFAEENTDAKSSLGMTLLLPYYTFPNLPGQDQSLKRTGVPHRSTTQDLADPNLFVLNSKLALSYYSETHFLKGVVNPSIYLIGQDSIENMNNENNKGVGRFAGKGDQENPPLPAELAATVAIQNYFASPIDSDSEKVVKLCQTEPKYNGEDLGAVLPEIYNVLKALNRLGMFCILWKILSKRHPHSKINFDLIPFRDLHDLKINRAHRWHELFHRLDIFVESATTYLLELDANKINLEWFNKSNEYVEEVISKNQSLNNSTHAINNKNINHWLWQIQEETNTYKNENNITGDGVYFRVLHALMKVCSSAYPYRFAG